VLEDLLGDILSVIVAVAVGIATGAVQFFLLYKFVTSVTGGRTGIKTLIFAVTQFLFPFAILVILAFLLPNNLIWAGVGIAASLITSAILRFIKVQKQKELPMKKQNDLPKKKQKELSKKKQKELSKKKNKAKKKK